MSESYGIVWQEEGAAPVAGKLEIGRSELLLEGNDRDHLIARTLRLADLVEVHVGRGGADRLDGHPTLLLELTDGKTVRIAALAQAGIVAEIAERIAEISIAAGRESVLRQRPRGSARAS